jgi:hypothetical protein
VTFAQPTPGNALVAVTQGFVKLSVTAEIVDVFGCDDFIGDDTLIPWSDAALHCHKRAARGPEEGLYSPRSCRAWRRNRKYWSDSLRVTSDGRENISAQRPWSRTSARQPMSKEKSRASCVRTLASAMQASGESTKNSTASKANKGSRLPYRLSFSRITVRGSVPRSYSAMKVRVPLASKETADPLLSTAASRQHGTTTLRLTARLDWYQARSCDTN